MYTGILGMWVEARTKQHIDCYKVMLSLNDSHEGLGPTLKALGAFEDLRKDIPH